MKHWRTTTCGVGTILGAVLTFAAEWLTNGVPAATHWSALGAAISLGIGLIRAADAKEVEAQK